MADRRIIFTPKAPMPNSGPAENASFAKTYCRFTPGRGQASIDGMATLGITGVEFELSDGTARHLWRYGELKTDEPIRPNAIDVLLSSREQPGASLFVQGPQFAAGLSERAPHVSQRFRQQRRRRLLLFFLAALAGLIAAGAILSWSPTKWIATSLPTSWRERLGTAARDSMTEGFMECVDPAGLSALKTLSERLQKGVPPGTTPFDIHVYDWSLMNAFAVPGGQIVLTKGLLDKAESPDEVAGVLAHEMGHGIEMHPEAGIIRGVGLGAAMEIMLGGTAGGGLANVGLMLAQLGYSRSAEREADHHALELLKAAAIAPKGLGDFFTRVTKMESDGSEAPPTAISWLRTHPLPAERARLVRMQPAYPATPALDSQAWENLKSVCNKKREPEKNKS
jgi:beta-barrel assembly-enhancing protease